MAVNKLGLTYKQTGRITLSVFNGLYAGYKRQWDLEHQLDWANKTFEDLSERVYKSQRWFT